VEAELPYYRFGTRNADHTAYPDWRHRLGYRCPSIKELQLAAAGGTKTPLPFGNYRSLLNRYSWNAENAGGSLHPVASLFPNALGFFDLTGNAIEWCEEEEWSCEPANQLIATSSYHMPGTFVYSDERYQTAVMDVRGYYQPGMGFRVSRTLRPRTSWDQ
jgi:formylglycine-generating enzyme required for sulfatase activity